jgi:hypothetical protein
MGSRTRRLDHVGLPAPVVGLLVGLLSVTLIAFWFENHGGALPSPAQPPLMVVTEQRGSDVTFEAHENIGTLWSKPGAPRAVWTLLVTTRRDQTGETALWQIETATPWPDAITYGRLPEGFTQVMPGRGAPPALQPNEHYVVSVRGPAGGGRTGFTFEPRRTSLYVPPHRWRDATSDLLTRPVRLTVTEET